MANSVKKIAFWGLLLPFLSVLLLVGLALNYSFGGVNASSSLISLSVSGLIISAWITYAANRLSRPLISPTMITASFTFQLSVLVLYLLVGGTSVITTTIYRPDMASNPFYVVFPLLILPLVTLVVVLFLRPFLHKVRNQSTLFMGLEDPAETQKLVYYLTVSAGLMFLSMPAVAYFGLLGYFIRVLWSALAMTPLLAGWLSLKQLRINYVWIIALGVGVILALFTGSRGIAFRSIGYFMAGRIIGSKKGIRTREILRVGVLGIILVILFGFIGNLRDQIGRIGVDGLSSERIISVFELSERQLSADTSAKVREETTLQLAFGRLIVAANLAVPLLTEKGIPLRGADGLAQEAMSYVDISLLSGSSKRSRLEQGLGSAAATRYGFNVSTTTSVPFPVIADGWSRAGFMGAVLFALFIFLIIVLIEFVVIYITTQTPSRRAILFCVIGIVAFFEINSSPAFSVLRTLMLLLPFTWGSLVCLDFFKRLVSTHRSQRSQVSTNY